MGGATAGGDLDGAGGLALDHDGVVAEKRTDVVVLQLGGEGTRTAAMLSGQIDGSLEQYPRTGDLEEKGFHVLVDCLEIAADYPNTSYVSTRAFIAYSTWLEILHIGCRRFGNRDAGANISNP